MTSQVSRWDDVGTTIPAGEAKYVVDGQPVAEYDNKHNSDVAIDIGVLFAFMNSYNANTILKADADDTPIALTVAEQTIVGRKTGGSIAALVAADVRTILNVADGSTADQSNAEIRTAVEAATDSNVFTDADHAVVDDAVIQEDFDANSILKANSDNTPIALTVAEQTLVGRLTGGTIDDVSIGIADNNIVQIDFASVANGDYARFTASGLAGRSYSEARIDLNVEDGSTADQTGAEIKGLYEVEANAFTDTKNTKLVGIAAGADVTADNAPQAHETSHESGGGDELDFDQLAEGTTYKKFLATERTKITGIDAGADVTASNAPQAHVTTHLTGGADAITFYDIDYDGYVEIDTNVYSRSVTGWAKVVEYTLDSPCDPQKFSFDMLSTASGMLVRGRLYVDGVAAGTDHTTTSTGYGTKTDILTGLSNGKIIQLYLYGHTSSTCQATNFQIAGENVTLNSISGGWT